MVLHSTLHWVQIWFKNVFCIIIVHRIKHNHKTFKWILNQTVKLYCCNRYTVATKTTVKYRKCSCSFMHLIKLVAAVIISRNCGVRNGNGAGLQEASVSRFPRRRRMRWYECVYIFLADILPLGVHDAAVCKQGSRREIYK